VVEQDSAILGIPHEIAIPIAADHRAMCRFPARESQKYQPVEQAIIELVQYAVGKAANPTKLGVSTSSADCFGWLLNPGIGSSPEPDQKKKSAVESHQRSDPNTLFSNKVESHNSTRLEAKPTKADSLQGLVQHVKRRETPSSVTSDSTLDTPYTPPTPASVFIPISVEVRILGAARTFKERYADPDTRMLPTLVLRPTTELQNIPNLVRGKFPGNL
jgi:hypothetical protein